MILNARMIFKKSIRRKAILLFVKKKPKKLFYCPLNFCKMLNNKFKFMQWTVATRLLQIKKNGLICLRTLFIYLFVCLFIYREFIYFAINMYITCPLFDIILLFHTSFLSVCNFGMYWRTTDTHRYNNFPDFSAYDTILGR